MPSGQTQLSISFRVGDRRQRAELEFEQCRCLELALVLLTFRKLGGGPLPSTRLAAIIGAHPRSLQARVSDVRRALDAVSPGLGLLLVPPQRRSRADVPGTPCRRTGYALSSLVEVDHPVVHTEVTDPSVPGFAWLLGLKRAGVSPKFIQEVTSLFSSRSSHSPPS